MTDTNKVQVFTNWCIVVLFASIMTSSIYTNEALAVHQEILDENDRTFYMLSNKHSTAVGKESQAEEYAWQHFKEQYVPKIFKECDGIYYTIYKGEKQVKIPGSSWFDIISPRYKTIPYWKIVGLSNLQYFGKIIEQDDSKLTVNLGIQARLLGHGETYRMMDVYVVMDYSYEILDVYNDGDDSFAVFGKGAYPKVYSCESLRAKINTTVEK